MEEDDTYSSSPGAAGSAASVDEGFGVGWWVDLDDQVDGGDVEAAGRDVGGEEDGW